MKKYLLLIITFIYFGYSFAQKSGSVKITGTAINFNNSVEVEDMSEFKDISLPSAQRIFIPDSNKQFSIQFKMNAPNYFRIGRSVLYLSPGDIIKASIDFKDPNKSVFNGSHNTENTFLKSTPYPKADSFLDGEKGINLTISSTVEYILKQGKQRKTKLDSIENKVTAEFYRLESIRIKADLMNSFKRLFDYYSEFHKVSKDSISSIRHQIDSITTPIIKNISVEMVNAYNLKLVVYRDVLATILKYQPPNYIVPIKITDWMKASAIKQKAIALDKKTDIIALKGSTDSIKTLQYKNAILSTINQLSKLNNGDIAKDIVFKDVNNNNISLSRFKGKVIYLEFWATWCGPCIEDKPKMELLKTAYKGNDTVVFLSVSIDDDLPKWSNYLSKHNISGNEFIVDRNTLTDYNLIRVPRMIMINKDFTIEQFYAPGPGDKQLMKTLNTMIQK
jgi:thiol-disulfide isomerase/thioredoxin